MDNRLVMIENDRYAIGATFLNGEEILSWDDDCEDCLSIDHAHGIADSIATALNIQVERIQADDIMGDDWLESGKDWSEWYEIILKKGDLQ